MAMHGFDREFDDLADYILRITERIWEGRNVGAIRRYYHPACVVHTGMGTGAGVEGVIAGTMAKAHQFPDRQILAEDVIGSGDDRRGFLSSHRSMMVQTHLGAGSLGAPTGKRIKLRAIADCAVIDNQIYEEWLVVDNSAAVLQAGLCPQAMARSMALADRESGAGEPGLAFEDLRAGPDTRVIQDDPAAAQIRALYQAMFGERDFSVIRQAYLRGVALHLPGGQDDHGHSPMECFANGYLASFPDAHFAIDHSMAVHQPGRNTRVATRWTLRGTHCGEGRFGPPTGAPMFIMGITHSEVVDGVILREWVMVDELAIWRRIERHRLNKAS